MSVQGLACIFKDSASLQNQFRCTQFYLELPATFFWFQFFQRTFYSLRLLILFYKVIISFSLSAITHIILINLLMNVRYFFCGVQKYIFFFIPQNLFSTFLTFFENNPIQLILIQSI